MNAQLDIKFKMGLKNKCMLNIHPHPLNKSNDSKDEISIQILESDYHPPRMIKPSAVTFAPTEISPVQKPDQCRYDWRWRTQWRTWLKRGI